MRNIILRLSLLICLVTINPALYAANLAASVDRNPIMVGESFALTVTADFKTNSNNLDHSALLKDFVVGATSVGNNTRIVNGEISQQTTWNINLRQSTAGTYTIPAFELDGVKSAPISVKVIEQPTSGDTQSANEDIKLVTHFNHDNAYVGQQLLYQVKLYIGASLQRAQLQAPSLEGAEISPLGEDADSSEILNGRRYRVITRNYSIRPIKAGQFDLKGSVFRGDISLSQRTSFFNNGRSKPVTLISDSKPFTVSEIPNNFPGQWLVSAHVALEDSWTDTGDYIVGEPITRTITLTAADTTVEQLPEISPDFGPTFNTYPDKKATQQGLNGTTLIAQAIQKTAVIPSEPGNFVIPAFKLPWFDSSTKTTRWATIPAKNITVLPSKQSPIPAPTSSTGSLPEPPPAESKPPTSAGLDNTASTDLLYWQAATVVLLLLLLISLVIIFKQRNAKLIHTPALSNEPVEPLRASLEKALSENNSNAILKLLPLWLSQYHQLDIKQLEAIDPQLADAYQGLAKQRYGNSNDEVDFNKFSSSFAKFCKARKSTPSDTLTSLYPKS